MAVLEHKPGYIILVVLTCVVFCFMLGMNALASIPGAAPEIFPNTTGDVSRAYNSQITPAGWAFSIWGLIYIWQASWLIYGLTLLCRSSTRAYLYVTPAHIPPVIYILFIFNNFTNVGWLILWSRFYSQYALMFLLMTALSLYLMIYLSCCQLHRSAAVLISENKHRDIWITRILLQNGLAIYAAWVTVASLLNLDIVMSHVGNLAEQVADILTLSLLLSFIISWFFVDLLMLDKYLRYVWSPYIAILVALTGSFSSNSSLTTATSVFTAFTLAIAVLCAVVKVVVMGVRHRRHPFYNREESILSFTPYNGNMYGSLSKSYDKMVMS